MTFLLFLLVPWILATAQQEMPLYGDQPIPNSRPVPDQERLDSFYNPFRYVITNVSHPTLTIYKPAAQSSGTAVIICPGGAYYKLSMTGEGSDVAKWLNSIGVTAFVLKYRLPSGETMIDKVIGPLQDAQRAIQLVRECAGEWAVDTNKIGILGFSAGGHLASSAGTHFLQPTIPNNEHISLRPDFMILIYPLISLSDSITHWDSRHFLLGPNPDPSSILAWSNERQVTQQTPPAFIVQAENDPGVPVWNSFIFLRSPNQKSCTSRTSYLSKRRAWIRVA